MLFDIRGANGVPVRLVNSAVQPLRLHTGMSGAQQAAGHLQSRGTLRVAFLICEAPLIT